MARPAVRPPGRPAPVSAPVDVANYPSHADRIAAEVAAWGPPPTEAIDRAAVLMRTELARRLDGRTSSSSRAAA